MRLTTRLLLAGAVVAGSFVFSGTASACEYPKPGCGGCKLNPTGALEGERLLVCYS